MIELSGEMLIQEAYRIARVAHEGRVQDGRPHISHVLEVYGYSKNLRYESPVQAACLLHDVIEQTSVTYDRLAEDGIPNIVIGAVEAVTATNQGDGDGLAEIMNNPIGRVVKFCDISANMENLLRTRRKRSPDEIIQQIGHYARYLSVLAPTLPMPGSVDSSTGQSFKL